MEGRLDEVRVILKYEQDYFFRPNHFSTCLEFNCNLTNWWIWSWRICTMTTRVVDLMMMMIRWSWWIQGEVDLDDLPDDDHWQEGGLTCQQAAWEGSSGCVPAQHTGANTSKHWRCRYRTIHTNTELGVNTTPTDEHYQHKTNTMVSEYYIYQDRPFLMHKTTRMPESLKPHTCITFE